MNIIIDTNRYTDYCRNVLEAVDIFQRAQNIYLPLIVLAELRAGFLFGKKSQHNESNLIIFMQSERVQILAPDEATSILYAQLFCQLRKQGTPIPTNDLWIASLAMQHNLRLFSRDKHFDHIAQLARASSNPTGA